MLRLIGKVQVFFVKVIDFNHFDQRNTEDKQHGKLSDRDQSALNEKIEKTDFDKEKLDFKADDHSVEQSGHQQSQNG